MKTCSPIRLGAAHAAFERLDARLRAWALHQGAEEAHFPVLIPAPTLHQAEYPEAFPHLLMAPVAAADPALPLAEGNTRLTGGYLSPAVCYHAYAALEGAVLTEGRCLTARGSCFRHEATEELAPGRRQIEFEMRELIFVGAPSWIEERLASVPDELQALTDECGCGPTAWQPASDPFFLPQARGKARMQKLLGTKWELCLPDGLAIASINRHRAFFGERFALRLPDGTPAHSACVAFGLDRWASQASHIL